MNTEIDKLIEVLKAGSEEAAEKSALALAELGRKALPALLDLAASPEPDHRWWAGRTLAEMDEPEIPNALKMLLNDDDPAVRQCAALGLAKRPAETAVPALVRMLSTDDRQAARLAGNALAAVGEPAVLALLDIMENGEQKARLEAVRALAEIGDKRAISVFFNAIQEGDTPLVEYWSEIGLERLGFGMNFFKP